MTNAYKTRPYVLPICALSLSNENLMQTAQPLLIVKFVEVIIAPTVSAEAQKNSDFLQNRTFACWYVASGRSINRRG